MRRIAERESASMSTDSLRGEDYALSPSFAGGRMGEGGDGGRAAAFERMVIVERGQGSPGVGRI